MLYVDHDAHDSRCIDLSSKSQVFSPIRDLFATRETRLTLPPRFLFHESMRQAEMRVWINRPLRLLRALAKTVNQTYRNPEPLTGVKVFD